MDKYRATSRNSIVEPAHLELAEPSIGTAYERCVEQGATYVVCHPYFLSKGRHVQEDSPALMLAASMKFPGTSFVITEPVGAQDQIIDLIKLSVDSATSFDSDL